MADDSESGRKLRTKQRKKYNDQDIDEDDIDGRRMYSVEEKLLSDKFDVDMVQKLKGPEFTMEWIQKNGLTRPIVFYDKTGLGLRVPSENFKVSDVKQCVGSRRILDVMDVNTQKALEMSMKDWVKYFENPQRDRLLNVISLEFCHTRLENYVDSPTLIRQIDWVDRAWPKHLKECQTESTNVIDKMKYPKVQKYCLMSVGGCYTDFHIDFGGTSVWYHILHGEKIFWLAPPSQKNIDRYVEWTLSAKQGDSFLGDTLEHCQRIQLRAGYTFIIPSGWIHAVYTPMDSLVFGGNFLHSFNVDNQLLVSRVEDKTYVPTKFKYPFYQEMMWYVVDRYIACLTGRTYLALSPGDRGDECGDEDDQGLIQVDEDSRPPSRNPDSRPPSRAMDEAKAEKEEETPRLSKSVTIELTRIDAASAALKRSPSEDENQPPASALGRPRGPRKAASDPNNSWEGGGIRKWMNLTSTELKGMKQLLDYLTGLLALPVSKRGVPKDMLDPEAVLRELRQVIEDHKADDQDLAVNGEPLLGWPELSRKKQRLKLGYKTYKTSKGARSGQTPTSSVPANSSNVQRRRRTRCKKCEACTRTECGECTFCKDMKKFGGPGRMKQTCISRQCMAPILPSASVCLLCNQGDQSDPENPEDISNALMECGICWEIVHPRCLRKRHENLENEGVVNEDLPNSWECLKCCNEGRQGQLKARPRPGAVSCSKRMKLEDASLLSADSEGSQEEEGGGSLSPHSPIEGKRVTAKEGGGMKCEFGTPIKWSNSSKRFSPMLESNIKEDSRALSSPSPHSMDENFVFKKGSAFSASPRDQKRLIKREKSPTNQNEESSLGPRKRHTPDKGGHLSQQPDSGSKRPKREKGDRQVDGRKQNGITKTEQTTFAKGSTKEPKTKLHLLDTKENGRTSGFGVSGVSKTEKGATLDESGTFKVPKTKGGTTVASEMFKVPKCRNVSSTCNESGISQSSNAQASLPCPAAKKTCMIRSGQENQPPLKISRHAAFEDQALGQSSAQMALNNGVDADCDAESPASPSPGVLLCSGRFDPIRSHRPGRRPLYRGTADWSKDFVPQKISKYHHHSMGAKNSGLSPRCGRKDKSGVGECGQLPKESNLPQLETSSVEIVTSPQGLPLLSSSSSLFPASSLPPCESDLESAPASLPSTSISSSLSPVTPLVVSSTADIKSPAATMLQNPEPPVTLSANVVGSCLERSGTFVLPSSSPSNAATAITDAAVNTSCKAPTANTNTNSDSRNNPDAATSITTVKTETTATTTSTMNTNLNTSTTTSSTNGSSLNDLNTPITSPQNLTISLPNSCPSIKTHIGTMLAQKLREAFVSSGVAVQKTSAQLQEHQQASLPPQRSDEVIITIAAAGDVVGAASAHAVQRIIVKHCSPPIPPAEKVEVQSNVTTVKVKNALSQKEGRLKTGTGFHDTLKDSPMSEPSNMGHPINVTTTPSQPESVTVNCAGVYNEESDETIFSQSKTEQIKGSSLVQATPGVSSKPGTPSSPLTRHNTDSDSSSPPPVLERMTEENSDPKHCNTNNSTGPVLKDGNSSDNVFEITAPPLLEKISGAGSVSRLTFPPHSGAQDKIGSMSETEEASTGMQSIEGQLVPPTENCQQVTVGPQGDAESVQGKSHTMPALVGEQYLLGIRNKGQSVLSPQRGCSMQISEGQAGDSKSKSHNMTLPVGKQFDAEVLHHVEGQVVSPTGRYQPLMFDHPYCQVRTDQHK